MHERAEQIGHRIRVLRKWRQMKLAEVAGLSGVSVSWLSMVERGQRAVKDRQRLEGIARALRVQPEDLDPREHYPVAPTSAAANPALLSVEAVLTEWWPGEVPDDYPAREWVNVRRDLTLLNQKLRPGSDYDAQADVLPALIHDLLIHASTDDHRKDAYVGLISAYHAAGNVASRWGAKQLGYVAAERVQAAAEALQAPDWLGVSAWTRAQFVSSMSRKRQYSLAVAAAEMTDARLESRGMGHLTAALAAASQGDAATAKTHLREAKHIADKVGLANSQWGGATMNFGHANVGIWHVGIGVELGWGAQVAEVAKDVPWQAIPTSRQGAYWMDLGRGLLQEKRSREEGLRAILKAEKLTPQQVRTNTLVREAALDMFMTAQRNAGNRELRSLLTRLGANPIV
ncbi:transcriptional regulator [Actinosynnema sp. ALI-1.44]|uniref:helix-turn-helix domain-containing protein n=1 Tax=Actinosynnema sp. ALI-1.44 TaxID=1933779 RepID=UPI00097C0185|nr:helix-turn-helix transcriptional regulator [Actinosynnema sp. ALI-1.44]ONI82932.1 transcriptional regulator [Actinosynnema sp. ALI-1.44]